jgi:eukaryotic-like serine/threonine-protein kinase
MSSDEVERICSLAERLPPAELRGLLAKLRSEDPHLLYRVSLRLDPRASRAPERSPSPPQAPATTALLPGVLTSGRLLGDRYRLESLLGTGGMGEVWLAFDLKLSVEIALKRLLFTDRPSDDRIEILRREVRTARDVASPHVCRVFDLVEIEGQEYVSMEYVDGDTLAARLEHGPALEQGEARRIAQQLLTGLQAIHDAGLIHRDLKPANVMITRSGRTVITDFGLAKGRNDPQSRVFAGTPAYMAPEQMSGDALGPWTDLFAVGVILAEMVTPPVMGEGPLRMDLWEGLRRRPPRVPEGTWATVIARAVAADPRDRFASAAELSSALGTDRSSARVVDVTSPYPGLTSFTEADAAYFFGRELDVESLWRKLQRLPLAALIGPSGMGKSSFLRAGVIPTRPRDWSVAICTPGEAPFLSLGRCLVHAFRDRPDVVEDLFGLHDPDLAAALLHEWRHGSRAVLLIVDQFEELFTLNPPEVQERFAALLGRASVDADVHVLVSMRDDFFFHCHRHLALRPLFSAAVPLAPLSREDLRRALVEPALQCGYRFEDDALVDDMLSELDGARGALPLLAFAAARLWDCRDRERALLTRDGYARIGGVAGALAQHAETALQRIGPEREPIVRELFRNLVTAQRTRSTREREELLSVFEDRASAAEVLNALIDARLITSFEVEASDGASASEHHVEIVHESLLAQWPRLVRWQTQDADGAQLRDQLRQAARLWTERHRSEDLLWTGTAYREFELWRERYSGGLTETEAAFGAAMGARARRDRRRRRWVQGGVVAMLLAMIGVFAWYGHAQQVAYRRAEAGKLVLLGRGQLEEEPTFALAYAIAALELDDTPVNRYFALEVMARGPAAWLLPLSENFQLRQLAFGPDEKQMVIAGSGGVQVIPGDGSPPIVVTDQTDYGQTRVACFTPSGEQILMRVGAENLLYHAPEGKVEIGLWSLQQESFVREFRLEGRTYPIRFGDRIDFATFTPDETVIREWAGEDHEPVIHGRIHRSEGQWSMNTDQGYTWHAIASGNVLYICPTDSLFDPEQGHRPVWERSRRLGEHADRIHSIVFSERHDDAGVLLATADASGEIRIWSPTAAPDEPLRILRAETPVHAIALNRDGTMLAARCTDEKHVVVWDLEGPRDARPRVFQFDRGGNHFFAPLGFDPTGRWLLAGFMDRLAIWPAAGFDRYVFEGIQANEFTPDSRTLIGSTLTGRLATRSLDDERGRELYAKANTDPWGFLDPSGQILAVTRGLGSGGIELIHVADGSTRKIIEDLWGVGSMSIGYSIASLSWSPDGRSIACWAGQLKPFLNRLYLIDVDTGEARVLEEGPYTFADVKFATDGSLWISREDGTIQRRDPHTGATETVARGSLPAVQGLSVSRDGRHALAVFTSPAFPTRTSKSELRLCDLEFGTSRVITHYGDNVWDVHLTPDGRSMATRSVFGPIRVGPTLGGEPHLFVVEPELGGTVQISSDGHWLAATTTSDTTTTLWRMPEGRPLHTLPHAEFLAHLRAQTNVRVVADREADSGYRVVTEPFPGLANLPIDSN